MSEGAPGSPATAPPIRTSPDRSGEGGGERAGPRGAGPGGNGSGAAGRTEPTVIRFRVPDMDCAGCLSRIRDDLQRMDGVVEVDGSPIQRTLTVELDPRRTGSRAVRDRVGRLGYSAAPEGAAPGGGARPSLWSGRQALLAYGSMALFLGGWVLRLAGADPRLFALPLHDVHLPDLLFLASALVGGLNFFPKGLRAARTLSLDMNFLMTVAILGAVGIGEYVEAAAIAFLFALAELLESYSVDRARASVEALMELAPDTARLRREGAVVVVPAEEVRPGQVVEVRPGDRVPVDGEVVEGASAVDESPVTGESLPVEKVEGARVWAGTINREGFLAIRVERPASESTLARIVELVEAAEARRSPTERFVERFARVYTPLVTVGAILTVAVPVLLFGQPFVPWFVRGLTLLVIACPCALVISTPVAVVSGVTAAARRGVLIKGGVHLEALGGVRAVALDKTGTLTLGHPRVVDVRPAPGVEASEILARAARLEGRSGHPVARAIVDAAADRRCDDGTERCAPRTGADPDVHAFASEPGKGVRGMVDGVEHRVGKPGWAAPGDRPPQDLTAAGRTVVAVAAGGDLLGWIAVADRPREGAAEAVEALRRGGIERVVMLTGDARETAEAVGSALGVDEIRAGLLPEDKVRAVEDLEARHRSVAMVGDGVNDAPALATATVGIVMGAAGSDAALETADVALMGDDLARLPWARELSRRSRRVIRQNIATAILVKAVLAVGVPLGAVSLITAVIVGDVGVSLAVTLNALRLGRSAG